MSNYESAEFESSSCFFFFREAVDAAMAGKKVIFPNPKSSSRKVVIWSRQLSRIRTSECTLSHSSPSIYVAQFYVTGINRLMTGY
jgi:hypothetical protein